MSDGMELPGHREPGTAYYAIGSHAWRFRLLPGHMAVHGQPLDSHVDESDHSVDIIDTGNTVEVFHNVLEARQRVYELELAMVGPDGQGPVFGGDIEPMSFSGDPSVPLLPDDPAGTD